MMMDLYSYICISLLEQLNDCINILHIDQSVQHLNSILKHQILIYYEEQVLQISKVIHYDDKIDWNDVLKIEFHFIGDNIWYFQYYLEYLIVCNICNHNIVSNVYFPYDKLMYDYWVDNEFGLIVYSKYTINILLIR